MAVIDVNLSGGEPFLREDILSIIEGLVQNNLRFSINSNGSLITLVHAEHLAKTGRCNSVQISLDGPSSESHDIFRGKGSFLNAVRGIKHLMQAGVKVQVRVTIHKRNLSFLAEMAHYLLVDLGLPQFSTNSASYLGLCRKNTSLVQLTAQERSEAQKILWDLNQLYPGRINAQAGPLAEAKDWMEIKKAQEKISITTQQNTETMALDAARSSLPNKSFEEKVPAHFIPSNKKGGTLSACGNPWSRLAITSDGSIIPCTQLSHLKMGNINSVAIEGIWKSHPDMVSLRERSDIPLTKFDECKSCKYLPFCRGGCPATAYTSTGELNVPSPDACWKKFFETGGKPLMEDSPKPLSEVEEILVPPSSAPQSGPHLSFTSSSIT